MVRKDIMYQLLKKVDDLVSAVKIKEYLCIYISAYVIAHRFNMDTVTPVSPAGTFKALTHIFVGMLIIPAWTGERIIYRALFWTLCVAEVAAAIYLRS